MPRSSSTMKAVERPRISCVRLSFGESEMEGCTRPLIIVRGPDSSSKRLHDRAGNSQTHARPLRLSCMERIKNPFSIFRRQSYAGIAHRNEQLPLPVQSQLDRQFAARVSHGLNRIQHQVHEDLLELHPVSQDIRHIFVEFKANSYGVSKGFVLKQNGHFSNDVFDINDLAFGRRAFLVEGPQTVDDISR